MVCTRPIRHQPDKKVDQVDRFSCGQCPSCKAAYSAAVGVRSWAEMQSTPGPSSFLTLTYAPDHLPDDGSVTIDHWQQFKRDLDYAASSIHHKRDTLRFVHCGEYGEKFARPHYHALIFRCLRRRRDVEVDNGLWTSPWLEELWGRGTVYLKAAHANSGMYIGQYCVKKTGGTLTEDKPPPRKIWRTNQITGEQLAVKKPYVTMSRNLGIGWLSKNYYDVYTHDLVRIDQKNYRPPKTFDQWLERLHPDMYEDVVDRRRQHLELGGHTNDPVSLKAKEVSLLERLKRKVRDYDQTPFTGKINKAWKVQL